MKSSHQFWCCTQETENYSRPIYCGLLSQWSSVHSAVIHPLCCSQQCYKVQYEDTVLTVVNLSMLTYVRLSKLE